MGTDMCELCLRCQSYSLQVTEEGGRRLQVSLSHREVLVKKPDVMMVN